MYAHTHTYTYMHTHTHTQEAAVLAKKAGKKLRPEYNPVQIFWHAGGGDDTRSVATAQPQNRTQMLGDDTQAAIQQQSLIKTANSNLRQLSSLLKHVPTGQQTIHQTIKPAISYELKKRPDGSVAQQTVTRMKPSVQNREKSSDATQIRSIQDRLGIGGAQTRVVKVQMSMLLVILLVCVYNYLYWYTLLLIL